MSPARAHRQREARAAGQRRSPSKGGRRPAVRLPERGSRSDRTRKNVQAATAESRRRGWVGASIAVVMRVGDELGHPFSRTSVKKYAPTAFGFDEHGRSHLRRTDRDPRRMDIITDARGVELGRTIRGSTDASTVSKWQNAVRWYLETGDDSRLRELSERERTIDRGRTVLTADPDAIQDLADSGALDEFRSESGS